MARKGRIDPEKEKYWRAVFRRFAKSGLPFKKFCEEEGIPHWNFQSWRRKLRQLDEANGIASTVSKGDNRPDKTKEKQAFWLRTIEEIEQHPGSISSFLQERGLASGSLWYWEKRLMKDGLTAGISAAKRSPFLPVEVVAKEDVELLQKQSRLSTETWRIEIRAGKGNTIFFPCDTHVDTLIRFVNGLED